MASLAVVAGPASRASAAWTAPADLSASGHSAFYPQVDADGLGNFMFAWEAISGSDYRAQARSLSAAGALASPQTLSPTGSDARSPQLGLAFNGDAVLGWERSNAASRQTRVRTLSAAGVVGGGDTISSTGTDGYAPQVDVNGNGDAAFAWIEADGRMYGRTRSAAGTFGPILALSGGGQLAWPGDVAIDPAGNAIFAWYRSDGTDLRVEAITLSAAGVLGGLLNVSDAGGDARDPQVAMSAAGAAVLTWQRHDGNRDRVQTRTLPAGGVLGTVRTLSDAGETASRSRVGLDSVGNAVIAWIRSDGSNDRAQAVTMSSVGTLGLVRTLSDNGQPAIGVEVAVNANGDAVLTWSRFDSVDWRIQARTLSAGGSLGLPWTVSDAGGYATAPKLATHNGVSVLTWMQSSVTGEQIKYAVGP